MLISKKAQGDDFNVITSNPYFKCAFIKHSEQYSFGDIVEMKRHNETDEIFVLLCGNAVMLTFDNNGFEETILEKETAYNVAKGTYHYLALSEDAIAFVTEKADTSSENTDVLKLENSYTIIF